MSPIAYRMHPETEVISCAIKYNNAPTDVFFGEAEIGASSPSWTGPTLRHRPQHVGFRQHVAGVAARHSAEDVGCTLAMARPIHAKTTGLSLAKLVAHYEAGREGQPGADPDAGQAPRGLHPRRLAAMEVYNKADTDQCAALFHKPQGTTPAEPWHLDCNIRMLVEPQFELDTGCCRPHLSVERSNKHKAPLDLAKLLATVGT